jgi:hypothetical protein
MPFICLHVCVHIRIAHEYTRMHTHLHKLTRNSLQQIPQQVPWHEIFSSNELCNFMRIVWRPQLLRAVGRVILTQQNVVYIHVEENSSTTVNPFWHSQMVFCVPLYFREHPHEVPWIFNEKEREEAKLLVSLLMARATTQHLRVYLTGSRGKPDSLV